MIRKVAASPLGCKHKNAVPARFRRFFGGADQLPPYQIDHPMARRFEFFRKVWE
jgi:hypothetical protein